MRPLKAIIQFAVGKFGYQLVKPEFNRPTYGLECLFPLLKKFGFEPKHVIDIGANRGTWTRTALRYFPKARYTLVEPQDVLKENIQDLLEQGRNVRWINAGLGDQPGTLPFTICDRDDASTFTINGDEAQAAGLQRINVQVRTLDEIISSERLPFPEMVKIDAEGFDFKVLCGAREVLRECEIVFVEAGVRCYPENSVATLIQYMGEHDYELLDITDINRSPRCGFLWSLELSFIKSKSTLLHFAHTYE